MDLSSLLESLLFVSTKPLTAKRLAELAGASEQDTLVALTALEGRYKDRVGGIVLARNGKEFQLMTSPENARAVQDYLREDMTGELTRPSLEALTIIAYRGPVTKAELEQIRGVNCSLILRNLLIRGLIEAEEDRKAMATRYRVTLDFLQYLGVGSVDALPDYEKLRADRSLAELLDKKEDAPHGAV